MVPRLRKSRAYAWLRELLPTALKFVGAGLASTAVGFLLLQLGVNLGLPTWVANWLQAVCIFTFFLPTYRKHVFTEGRIKEKYARRRWFVVKISSVLLVTPVMFDIYSLWLSYRLGYVATTATTGVYSFSLGFWSFGKKFPLFAKSPTGA